MAVYPRSVLRQSVQTRGDLHWDGKACCRPTDLYLVPGLFPDPQSHWVEGETVCLKQDCQLFRFSADRSWAHRFLAEKVCRLPRDQTEADQPEADQPEADQIGAGQQKAGLSAVETNAGRQPLALRLRDETACLAPCLALCLVPYPAPQAGACRAASLLPAQSESRASCGA